MTLENIFFNHSFIEVSYTEEFNCEYVGCNQESICRCSQIKNLKIDYLNLYQLSKTIFNRIGFSGLDHNRKCGIIRLLYGYDFETITIYCIYRILRINRLWLESNWILEVIDGYYGQELEKIKIEETLFNKISSEIDELIKLDRLEEKIHYLLKLEYGWIFDKISYRSIEIRRVEKKSLQFGKQSHYQNVKNSKFDHYKSISWGDIPLGVVRKEGEIYKVIDGYHRLIQNDDDEVLVFVYI
jgi:hypothetical protein